jgi:hypothetical protein
MVGRLWRRLAWSPIQKDSAFRSNATSGTVRPRGDRSPANVCEWDAQHARIAGAHMRLVRIDRIAERDRRMDLHHQLFGPTIHPEEQSLFNEMEMDRRLSYLVVPCNEAADC